MLVVGVLWPGLQVAETVKERRALYERHQVSRQLDQSRKSKKIGEPEEPVKWRRRPICTKNRKARQVSS